MLLQDPSANAGAGKGINEGAADITDGMAVFDTTSAYAASPLPKESLASSGAAAKIRGSSTSAAAPEGSVAGIDDAVAAGQAGGFNALSKAGIRQQGAAEAKQADTASMQGEGAAASSASAAKKQGDILAKVSSSCYGRVPGGVC